MKRIFPVLILSLGALALPARGATIVLNANSPVAVGSLFDVVVQATDVFAGRSPDDWVIAYGFNVGVGNPAIFQYAGETAGSLFDDVSGAFGGSPMVAGIAASPPGIGPADVTGPLTLATLRFRALAPGAATVSVTWDEADLNQGLVYLNLPYGAISASIPLAAEVPEPGGVWTALGAVAALCLARLRRR